MSVELYPLFEAFAQHTEGRLPPGMPRGERTRVVVDFFSAYVESLGFGQPRRDYMAIDAVWRDPRLGYIALAVEHENSRDIKTFLSSEVQHLVDLKAERKVAIGYPHAGEETDALTEITRLIQQSINATSDLFGERYLVIFGTATYRDSLPAIQWKGYFFDRFGKLDNQLERVVRQAAGIASGEHEDAQR